MNAEDSQYVTTTMAYDQLVLHCMSTWTLLGDCRVSSPLIIAVNCTTRVGIWVALPLCCNLLLLLRRRHTQLLCEHQQRCLCGRAYCPECAILHCCRYTGIY